MEKHYPGEILSRNRYLIWRFHTYFPKCSTPYGLDESLPNDERGILHIEDGNYWYFYGLE